MGALWQRRHGRSTPIRPLSYSATGRDFFAPTARAGITDWRGTADTPSYDHNRMQQKRTDFAFPLSRERQWWAHLAN